MIKDLIDKNAVIQTDDSTSYLKFEEFIEVSIKEISNSREVRFKLN